MSDSPKTTLDDFCLDLSLRDKRVEMIGAFHYNQRMDGYAVDSVENFQSRYDAFVIKPV